MKFCPLCYGQTKVVEDAQVCLRCDSVFDTQGELVCRRNAHLSPEPSLESIVKEYVEARDAYEDATGIHRVSFAHPKRLPHGDAITRRWVDARAALYKAIGHVKTGELRIEHAPQDA